LHREFLSRPVCARRGRAAAVLSSRHLLAWIGMLVIYAIAFFCLPDEAAYLIPAIPFIRCCWPGVSRRAGPFAHAAR
jgi:hypothetical protein